MSIENKIAAQPDQSQTANVDAAPTGPQASIPDLTKRRLMRGAAAAAPVLLTLRSGALAASSCTGLLTTGIQINNGVIPTGTTGAAENEYCLAMSNINSTGCAPTQINQESTLTNYGKITSITDTNNQTNLVCMGNGTGAVPGTESDPITYAILSSGAAQSLGINF